MVVSPSFTAARAGKLRSINSVGGASARVNGEAELLATSFPTWNVEPRPCDCFGVPVRGLYFNRAAVSVCDLSPVVEQRLQGWRRLYLDKLNITSQSALLKRMLDACHGK